MSRDKNFPNAFYLLVVLLGGVFMLTAFAYTVMVVQEARNGFPADDILSRTLAKYGVSIFVAEVTALALASVCAMAHDRCFPPKSGSSR